MSDLIEVEPGVWSVIEGARVYEVRVAGEQILVNGRPVEVVRNKAAAGLGTGPVHVRATMPGKVVRVLVEVGENVTGGQGVIVVEAMKMQNELKSPRDGRVTHIAADAHTTVDAGAVLVTIE
jgi:biotin carboxyl carrier protein